MVDFIRSTGDNGTMMIRDLGDKVQFWIKAAPQVSGFIDIRLSYNGNNNRQVVFDFQKGGDWQLVRQTTVGPADSQTVEFYLYQTAGPSLGGPTNLSAFINRNTVPEEPTMRNTALTTISASFAISDGDSNGGDPIDLRQIAWRKTTQSVDDLDFITLGGDAKTGTAAPLTRGTDYYFYCRTHNRHGWSTYSPRIKLTTLDDPDAPGIVKFSAITQISVKTSFTDGDNGGTAITARQVGWSLSSTGDPTTIVTYNGATTVTGLLPARKYYFRSRTKNSVGWSAWSAASSFTTLSGVRINVNGSWKQAVPYVKVGGVWKLTRPWGRQYGYWEETT